MTNALRVILAILLIGCTAAGRNTQSTAIARDARTYALIGGRWFDGIAFVPMTMYVVGAVFADQRPARVDSVVDLTSGYVVPPLGDAHTHNLDGPVNLDTVVNAYVREGTFYVQVLTNLRTRADAVRGRFNRPGALDVAYAHGGLTCTLGHPFMAYEPRGMGLTDPREWPARSNDIRQSRTRENDAYWFLDSLPDVEAKWPQIVAGKPDVIKIYLLDTERYDSKKASSDMALNGLRADLVPEIVRRAHAAGLRVWAHVETAHDFGVAARAGVDGFAHLPTSRALPGQNPERYRISDEDAQSAARNGAAMNPTVKVRYLSAQDSSRVAQIQHEQRYNLRLLTRHGVAITVGLDVFGQTARDEVHALRALGLWSNRDLLTMWAETTPRAIVPARKIGRLLPGYEASLLVLGCDPIENFDCTAEIQRRMKQGVFVQLPN